MQNSGKKDINVSFAIRPIHHSLHEETDTLNTPLTDSGYMPQSSGRHFLNRKAFVRLLPLTITHQYTTHHPYGWNDGAVIAAKGYQNHITFGVYSRIGPVSIQLQPEFTYTQNKNFQTFPESHSDSIWRSYYYVFNRIDVPEQFGEGSFIKVFPGQSSVRLHHKKLSIGVSTENLWWGPGIRNSLLMSNNAPGFAHLTFNTTSPVTTGIGSFEWQVIAGKLKNSNIAPTDTIRRFFYNPKPDDDRYLNGMIVTWQPKWIKGLHLGVERVFYQYQSSRASSVDGYLPVFSKFFKRNTPDEGLFGRDQMLSVFMRMVMPESKSEVYIEYGRNDHSHDLIDLLLEPEHARAYIIGARRILTSTLNKEVELFMEFTHLQNPPTKNVRALEGWYTHYQVRHGYTHRGQVIGAGIGPGGSSQTAGANFLKGYNKFGVMLERVVHNNDFYYDAFVPKMDFSSHWLDLSLNLNKHWTKNKFTYAASITLIRSLNYQWQHDIDKTNLISQLSVSYLF